MQSESESGGLNNQVIELPMMNVPKFIVLSATSGFLAQTAFYPLITIRTRIQIQKQVSIYRGSFHAFSNIVKTEGVGALYGGFWVKCVQLLCGAQFIYVLVYEGTRSTLGKHTSLSGRHRAFTGGALASLAAQTIVVPVDIVSQHLQLGNRMAIASRAEAIAHPNLVDSRPLANGNGNCDSRKRPNSFTPSRSHSTETGSGFRAARHVVLTLYREGGLLAFYRGYAASVLNFVPNSALWWSFYDRYCDTFVPRTRSWLGDTFGWQHVPQTPIKCVCASLAGASAALFTNVLDCIRVRMQVQHTRFVPTVRQLYLEEGLRMFAKGLSARLLYSSAYSFVVILGYEPIKKLCLKPQFADKVNW